MIAKGPIVATFHAATIRSKWLAAWGPVVRPWLERISGRIAVSDFARRVQVEHLGGDAVIIPNGVHVAAFADGPVAARLHPRRRRPDHRLPRPLRRAAQGPAGAARGHAHRRPPVPGRAAAGRRPGGRRARSRELIGADLRPHGRLLGELTEADKAAFLRSVDVYCAPNLLGESFGVVLIEALAAGRADRGQRPRRVRPRCWRTARPACWSAGATPAALAAALCATCSADPARRAELSRAGRRRRGRLRLGRARPADPRRLRDGRAARRRRGRPAEDDDDRSRGARRAEMPARSPRRRRAHR